MDKVIASKVPIWGVPVHNIVYIIDSTISQGGRED